jgi:hypothetical protein
LLGSIWGSQRPGAFLADQLSGHDCPPYSADDATPRVPDRVRVATDGSTESFLIHLRDAKFLRLVNRVAPFSLFLHGNTESKEREANMVMPMGVCYGPYHQKDKAWSSYTSADIDVDMTIIKKYFHHIRTYSMRGAGKYVVGAGSNHKVRVSLGVWIYKDDWNGTKQDIDTAIGQAVGFPGTVIHLVVGNEVNRIEQNYSTDEAMQAMNYAKQQVSSHPSLQGPRRDHLL